MTDIRVERFPCGLPACGLPALFVVGEKVMIESRHHGHHHTTFLTMADLRKLLDKMENAVVA